MKFEPWEKFKKEYEPEPIDVKKPPCPHCKHWKPVRKYQEMMSNVMRFDGVQLCHTKEMCNDFSCYRDKEEEALKSKKSKPTRRPFTIIGTTSAKRLTRAGKQRRAGARNSLILPTR